MKFASCTAAILFAALVPATAQVVSHAPTPMHKMGAPASASTSAPSQVLSVTGKPVVRINGNVLTDRDLLREMFAIFPYAKQHGGGFPKSQEADIRRGALEMIEYEELVYQDAERRKMTVPQAQVKKGMDAYRASFGTDENFKIYLNTELGGSMEQFERQVRRSLLIEHYLNVEVKAKSKVTEAEARAYYHDNPKAFHHGEAVAFQTISIMPGESASADVKQKAKLKAEDVLKQAKATKTFEQFGLLAEKFSEDDFHVNMGDHKLVEASRLPPEMLTAIRRLNKGQVSGLLQFGSFYTIVRLNERILAGNVPFQEIKSKLLSDLQKTKYDRMRGDLDKRLREHAKVEEL
jgi:parvulin-like peptidyl-prolyl isomerase